MRDTGALVPLGCLSCVCVRVELLAFCAPAPARAHVCGERDAVSCGPICDAAGTCSLVRYITNSRSSLQVWDTIVLGYLTTQSAVLVPTVATRNIEYDTSKS
eukprot:6190737-Pleurochrysis_carterae.AAC.2